MLQEIYSYMLFFYMLNSFLVFKKAGIKQIKFFKIKKINTMDYMI